VTFWTEKILYIYNQGLDLGEAKEAVISGLPFESFASRPANCHPWLGQAQETDGSLGH